MIDGLTTATVVNNTHWSGGRLFLYMVVRNIVCSSGMVRGVLHLLDKALLDLFSNNVVIGL